MTPEWLDGLSLDQMSVKGGDVLVVRADHLLSRDAVERIEGPSRPNCLLAFMASDIHVLVLDKGLNIGVLHTSELAEDA